MAASVDANWFTTRIQGAVVPFYSGQALEPCAVMRIDSVYRDYQRRGFYKIGLLPIGVMEGVTIEFDRLDAVSNSLARIRGWITPHAARQMIEMRRVAFIAPSAARHRLEAGRVRLAPDGQWELLDRVTFFSGSNRLCCADQALLQVTGPSAGRLVWSSNPSSTNDLFTLFSSVAPQTFSLSSP